jgi:hypothetical protein
MDSVPGEEKSHTSNITIFESLSRNFVRAIDFLPTFYVVGTISIFVSSRWPVRWSSTKDKHAISQR